MSDQLSELALLTNGNRIAYLYAFQAHLNMCVSFLYLENRYLHVVYPYFTQSINNRRCTYYSKI